MRFVRHFVQWMLSIGSVLVSPTASHISGPAAIIAPLQNAHFLLWLAIFIRHLIALVMLPKSW